jgi:hypothetical protein
MKPNESPATSPATSAQQGEAAAAYIAQELPKARKALRRSRIVGLVLIGVVGGYISIISLTLVKFFQPQEAAQIATGMLIQHIDSDGPVLALQVERQIPLLIRQLPDYVIQQLPAYRQEVEHSLTSELQSHCAGLSKELGKHLDTQLNLHVADLQTLLARPNDRTALRAVLPDLEQTVTGFLTTDADGKLVQTHINDLAAGLKEIEKHMDRLANGSDLTPQEKKARRSLAVLAKAIRDNTATPAPVGKLASK